MSSIRLKASFVLISFGVSQMFPPPPSCTPPGKVYDLNETSKRTARSQEQHDARGRYMTILAVMDDNDLVELKKAAQKFMNEYYWGPRPYAAAVFDILHERLERTRYDPAVLLGECRKKS